MRKIIVSEFVSLDGVMEDPGGAKKFKHGGWTRPYWNEEIGVVLLRYHHAKPSDKRD